ncbi:molybdopterin molybdochelatase [Sphingomonas laterariae]|uniref:Molybdopterin molybdenumtransferase n=1 Tax=Edaphosphingomonas laterariae TaxID=861865 RepID=A0A239IQB0_9SPHN|nr:molybdopterin molybdotransferase MoeA [Sphingomonas laterariae]SNS94614.1 molybdopterin molybdochelatase [Sphingomonas laterariae]
MADLIPLSEAQARLLALGVPLPEENAALADALGRWAARDIKAIRTQPAADLSAMDGYAIRFAEMPGPWRVVGESAAGSGSAPALAPHEAVRIFTGAPVPAGADAILVQEEAAREGDRLVLAGGGPPRVGAHIRRAGGDFTTGDTLIPAAARITPARIALAATGGHGALPVRRRPRIALLSTGDELVPAGAATPGVCLPSSNAPMLAAMIAGETPAIVEDRGIVPDDLAATTAAIAATAGVDILVTTGGASVGDRDFVRPALEAAGAAIDFWRVALKPGKPIMAGRIGDTIVLGLPGNPVSAFVTARLFLLPLIRHLGGAGTPFDRARPMRLAAPLPATGKRAEYLRGQRVGARIRPVGSQDSAALAALATSEALIVRPPHAPPAQPGDVVMILPIA